MLGDNASSSSQFHALPRRLDGSLHLGRLQTRVGSRTRYYNFTTLDSFRSFVERYQPEDATLAGFEHSLRAWGPGQRERPLDAGAVREAGDL
jgi:hypothetical protein